MKKLRKFNLLFSAVILCSFLFGFSSCSNISSNESESGSVSFALGPEVFKAALSGASKSYTGGILRNEETDWILEELKNISYKMEISINGGYTASAERIWKTEDIVKEIDLEKFAASGGQESDSPFDYIAATLSKDAKFEFTGIPVGKSVYAECKVFEIRTYNGQTEKLLSNKQLLLHGRSSEITIKGGENTLQLAIYEAYDDFSFEVTLEFDEGTNVASIISKYPDFRVYPYAVDSDFVSGLYSAADDYEVYEAANKHYEAEKNLDALTPIWIENDNYSISGSTLTVKGNMEAPVSITDKTKGTEIAVIPIAWSWESAPAKAKYVGLYTTGGAKTTITPSKSDTNKLSIKMKKLDVLDTKYALYNNVTDGSGNSSYQYYLSSSADQTGTSVGNPTINSFCFDADGNFYSLKLTDETWYITSTNSICESVKATVTYSEEGTVDVTSGMCTSPVIFVDRKTNVLYMAISSGGANTTVVKYPDLISSGATTNSVAYDFSIPDSTYMLNPGQPMTIYNGVVYAVAIRSDYPNKVIKVDLSNASDVSEIDLSDVSSILTSSVSITDMIYQDDAVYLLIKESNLRYGSGENNFALSSRGGVIRYDVLTGSVDKIGWTDSSNGTQFKYGDAAVSGEKFMPVYSGYNIYYEERVYDNQGGSSLSGEKNLWTTAKSSTDFTGRGYPNQDDSVFSTAIPAVASLTSQLCGPQKFIAIKPKKLVIADSGIAFYTDNDGVWKYKNINRVVTVDLNSFASFDSINTDTALSFAGKNTGYIYLQASGYEANLSLEGDGEYYWTRGDGSYYSCSKGYAGIPCGDE